MCKLANKVVLGKHSLVPSNKSRGVPLFPCSSAWVWKPGNEAKEGRTEGGRTERGEVALFQEERAGIEAQKKREQIRAIGRLRCLVSGPQSTSLCLLLVSHPDPVLSWGKSLVTHAWILKLHKCWSLVTVSVRWSVLDNEYYFKQWLKHFSFTIIPTLKPPLSALRFDLSLYASGS